MNGSWVVLAVLLVWPVPHPEDPGDPETVARGRLERGEELVRAKRYDDARALYAKTAKEFPETVAGKECAWRSKPSAYLGWSDLVRNGPSENRADIVVLGEGYEQDDLDRFDQASEDLPQFIEREPLLAEYASYFNFLRGTVASKESGIEGYGREYDTALGAYLRSTDRVDVAVDPARVRAVLERIPGNDGQSIVLVRLGMATSSEAGVTVFTGTTWDPFFHHFGHGFGLLGDEYPYDNSKPKGQCAADHFHGPNVSESPGPELVPWSHWLAAKVPDIGVIEGAAGRLKDAYRPSNNCAMLSNRWYCPVCREAMLLRIYTYVDPIDGCTPAPPPPGASEPLALESAKLEFEVRVMRPRTHQLESRWWVLPAEPEAAPRGAEAGGSPSKPGGTVAPSPAADGGSVRDDRTARGPLKPIEARPDHTVTSNERNVHRFEVRKRDLAPGRHRVVCRVRDTTKLRDEKWPWVLADPRGLLESERVWWIEVPAAR